MFILLKKSLIFSLMNNIVIMNPTSLERCPCSAGVSELGSFIGLLLSTVVLLPYLCG